MKKLRIVSFLVLSIFLSLTAIAQVDTASITLDDIMKKGTFYENGIDWITPMNDGAHYAVIEDDTAIVKYSYKTGKRVAEIVSVVQFGNEAIKWLSNFKFSANEQKLIFYTNRQNIYRRSFTANYYVWDIAVQKFTAVSDSRRQQVAELSPDGTKVAYVSDNNLYVKNLTDGSEMQITTDGEFNKIINGIPDWVYEEEFEYNRAFCWSPDSRNLAWCRFDESAMRTYGFAVFAGQAPRKAENALYPSTYSYKYPKAGEANSVVTVWNYSFSDGRTTQIDVGAETDQYIPRITWSPAGKLVVYRLNRLQNHLELLYANPADGTTQVFYDEQNKWYIDESFFDYLTFNADGSKFLIMSERDGWSHIYLHKADGTLLNQVTKGEWDVTDFYGFDERTNTIFYQSAERGAPNRDVYSVKANGTAKTLLSKQLGTNDFVFSKGFKYYISEFSNASTPTVYTLHERSGKQLRVLEDNAALADTLKIRQFCPKEFLQFTTDEGIGLNAWMIKPHDFNPSKKYPVLMVQYSGPNSQQVLNQFDAGWEQVLAANGYIVFCCDGRGTGARGEAFRKITYLQLGKYELADQLAAARYLKSLPYVAVDRIGIWGWSFGGFMVLNCMTQGNGTFKAGIAVAPVTNWRYYDNIYTERFMRTPQVNADGYDLNSPITHAADLQGNLLLIHGSADDNVHWQNSAEMCEALVQADKQFDYFVYTNRNHSIYGGNTRWHLYNKMLRFVLEKL